MSTFHNAQEMCARAVLILTVPVFIAACSGDKGTENRSGEQPAVAAESATPDPKRPTLGRYVDLTDSLPRIQFNDGKVSLNDRCMVRKTKLNLHLPPVYVNREPVAFC